MPARQPPYLLRLTATNYRSLQSVDVALGPVNVLVGPNGAGKSNLLDVVEFLGDSVRHDISGALDRRGGIQRLRFRGTRVEDRVLIGVQAVVTRNSSRTAPDDYRLAFWPVRVRRSGRPDARPAIRREETFVFKRTAGRGRRITLSGRDLTVATDGTTTRSLDLSETTLALATLPKLGPAEGGEQVEALANLFASFRVFDVDVEQARTPSRERLSTTLHDDAGNLSSFLRYLSETDPDGFARLEQDARRFVPGLTSIGFEDVGGAAEASYVVLGESGLSGATPLADASYGSIRALALLALLYDPRPPKLTCIEEIDHGLHPHVLDRLVELVRQAGKRTQFLIATHSPSLVNRLRPDELLVCERGPDGASVIPAVDSATVRRMKQAAGGDLQLGELWFSGLLGGVPEE